MKSIVQAFFAIVTVCFIYGTTEALEVNYKTLPTAPSIEGLVETDEMGTACYVLEMVKAIGPGSLFEKENNQVAFNNKIDAILQMLKANNREGAKKKIEHDLIDKVDKWVKFEYRNSFRQLLDLVLWCLDRRGQFYLPTEPPQIQIAECHYRKIKVHIDQPPDLKCVWIEVEVHGPFPIA